MQPTLLGVVLLLDTNTESYVTELSRSLEGNKIQFTSPPYVHLSLLHAFIHPDRMEESADLLRRAELPSDLSFECFELLRNEGGWHFVEVHQTADLIRLQHAILPIAKLRARDTYFSWRKRATPAQHAAFGRHGYPNVGMSAWSPHLTYGMTQSAAELTREPICHKAQTRSIALVEVGQNGVAGRIRFERPC